MKIFPINSTYLSHGSKVNSKSTSRNLSFLGVREEIGKHIYSEVPTFSEYTSIFEKFINMAMKEGKIDLKRCVEALSSEKSSFRSKLEYAKKFSNNEDYVIISDKKGPLVSMRYGTISLHGNYIPHLEVHEHIDYSLDKNGNYVVERPFDNAKFYPNKNIKEFTKYTTDYSESKTTYYKEDGSENNLRNFFSFFGL